jgi:hypothetical protein
LQVLIADTSEEREFEGVRVDLEGEEEGIPSEVQFVVGSTECQETLLL